METYVALLRGINVSGKNIIKMEDLRPMFERMQFSNVATFIQSGNVIFSTKATPESTLLKKIEKALEQELGYSVPVMLRTHASLATVVSQHPFGHVATAETRKLYVTFLHETPSAALQETMLQLASAQEKIHFIDRELYIAVEKDMSKPVFTNVLIEKKLKMSATTRNWATVNKLVTLSAR
ncbi:uncharacterized protein (DUF1697 family) [Chitinophaga dinghuensis]|uniref:Uncharacterized protein (DUF1697 family) n=1 Tax=Chitinophaga dinghuensis TaxID=1539050 RepID=A0A327VVI0_9BACT|nr:DUF1697 domain-containing protein [Chitinophaga dinghuensis]RAJ79997.1 uncharacterized protein (DUF1697 family) [Chitinophaga dinghuensis]